MLLALVSSAATGAVLGVDDPLTTPASAFFVNGRRPPGTLLLNILAKNEEVHLRRTLPEWAKLIDYWVIGLDEFNTDKSAAVIHSILGAHPGRDRHDLRLRWNGPLVVSARRRRCRELSGAQRTGSSRTRTSRR